MKKSSLLDSGGTRSAGGIDHQVVYNIHTSLFLFSSFFPLFLGVLPFSTLGQQQQLLPGGDENQ
jgi:hypothetical protein